MEVEASRRLNAVLAMAAGLLALLSVFYYIEQFTYLLGEAYGVIEAINAYNITTATSPFINLVSAAGALSVGMYFVYAMLPFAVLMLSVGIIWLISRQFKKIEITILGVSSVTFLFLTVATEFNFHFSGTASELYVAYVGALAGIAAALYPYFHTVKKMRVKRAYPIEINPETPYTNMLAISSKLMRRLGGDVRVLDQHFDVRGVENLARLLGGNEGRYSRILILTKGERLGKDFERSYYDLREELANKGVTLEIRIMNDEDAVIQHERLIMDDNIAYKIPPLNIINKKSEHIVGVNHGEAYARFKKVWDRAAKYEAKARENGGSSQ